MRHLGPPSPEATFEVFLAGRGGPKVKQLRFGAILTKIVAQQHTVIGSKSDFLNKFGDIWAPLPEATFEVLLAARGGPKVKQLRFGAILTNIVGQQHTVIGSTSDFLNKI